MFSFDVNSMVAQLAPAASKVAESLGTTSDSLIRVGIQGQRAEGVGYFLISVFLILLMVGAACAFYHGRKVSLESGGYGDEGWAGMAVGSVVGGIALCVFPFTVWNAAIHLAAPEYALMLEVRDALVGNNH